MGKLRYVVEQTFALLHQFKRLTVRWERRTERHIDHDATLGIDVEILHRDPAVKGFKAIPRCWVVERTFRWLMNHPASPATTKPTRPVPKPWSASR